MTYDTDDRNDDLASDVSASLGNLMNRVDMPDETGPMGMNPRQLGNMFKMKMTEWAAENDKKAMKAFAIVHLATRDIIDKHADETPEEIATRRE